MKFALLALALLGAVALVAAKDRNNLTHKAVCYFATWTTDGGGENHFTPEDLNPHVCTHVNIAFAKLTDNKLDISGLAGIIHRVTALRSKNPHLSVLISVGGWGDGSTKYSQMAQTEAHRQTFIKSVLDVLKQYDLDGLDFDWEFPGFAGVNAGDRTLGRAQDKQDFTTLLSELHTAFQAGQYILSGAITSSKYNIEHAYDIAGINKYFSFINLMTYDYHGPWSHAVGHNAPLHPDATWSADDKLQTVQFTVDYFLQHGADPHKLVLGIPLYGYGFDLASPANTKVGAGVRKATEGGTYAHICKEIKAGGWTQHWDEHAQVPFAVKGSEYITYDNLRSVQQKLLYAQQKQLGGAMVWEVNGDDHKNACGDGKFPIMKRIMATLNKVQVHD